MNPTNQNIINFGVILIQNQTYHIYLTARGLMKFLVKTGKKE